MIQKNQEYIVDIIDYGFSGEGIAKIDNMTVFIPGAMKDETVKIIIVKVLSSHAFGKVIKILEPSKHRTQSDCTTFPRCGGCTMRHMDYQETLKIKQNTVQNLVNKTLKQKIIVNETIGMQTPYHYRNKAQYPLGLNKDQEPAIGIFASRSHEIIPMKNCAIQNPLSEEIATFIFDFLKEYDIPVYSERSQKGLVRHIVIKIGLKTNEVMCILVTNGKVFPKQKEMVTKLTQAFPNIKTIIQNINLKNTNVILGNQNITLYGEGYIFDKLGEYTFKISPMSFYQVNPIQTEVLYNKAIELTKLDKQKENVALDLYCGIGTIAIFISKYFNKVYGVEIIEQAIEDAKENAKINKVTNIEFMTGDVEPILTDLIENKKIMPDVVFVDPPRKGLDTITVNNILKIQPKKVTYISCNPATLTRDLAKLEEKYTIQEIQPVDMFPYTSHVECVAVLVRKTIEK